MREREGGREGVSVCVRERGVSGVCERERQGVSVCV